MEYCEKCKKNTYYKQIRSFPIPNGRKVWVGCTECNNIKIRVIKNDN